MVVGFAHAKQFEISRRADLADRDLQRGDGSKSMPGAATVLPVSHVQDMIARPDAAHLQLACLDAGALIGDDPRAHNQLFKWPALSGKDSSGVPGAVVVLPVGR